MAIFGSRRLHLIVRNDVYYFGFYGNDCVTVTKSEVNESEWVAFVYNKERDGGRMSIVVNGEEVRVCSGRKAFTDKARQIPIPLWTYYIAALLTPPLPPHRGAPLSQRGCQENRHHVRELISWSGAAGMFIHSITLKDHTEFAYKAINNTECMQSVRIM